ncbi:MAG: serine/threonine protein kinase, partial [Candidatus Krumholzibacteriota bacterium]|nr:serine/threonine protein kinase [Candidatus Krumholzibacteriota bacterium]
GSEQPHGAGAAPRRNRLRYLAPWMASGAIALAALVLGATHINGRSPVFPVIRTSILPPDDTPWDLRGVHPGPATLSPDGRQIAFTARNTNGTFLFVRDLADYEARMLQGTQGAGYPFWSPDSRSIGFFADGKLKRIEAEGGPPIALCEAPVGKGGTWNGKGTIVFAPSFNSPLHKVPATGGASVAITRVDGARGENSHRFPQFLPDGEHFIYLSRAAASGGTLGMMGTAVRVGSLSDTTGRDLMPAISNAVYASGHVLFLRENVLMARPFEPKKIEFTGDAFPLVEQVRAIPGASRGIFDASQNGLLVYQSGAKMPGNQPVWLDLEGEELARLGEPLEHDGPTISPDGKKVAIEVYDVMGGTPDIWIYDVDRGIRTRFTFDSAPETDPVWSPDGARIAFASARDGTPDIFVKSVFGGGTEVPVISSDASKWPADWTPDGKLIVFQEAGNGGAMDICAVPAGGGASLAVVHSSYNETQPSVSPDGRWMAYSSDETGRSEVYVTYFPRGGRKWQVSLAGGALPHWRPDGGAIFYLSLNSDLHVADVGSADSTFTIGESRRLFDASSAIDYDVAPDGKRLLLLTNVDQHQMSPVTLLTNWPALAREKRR